MIAACYGAACFTIAVLHASYDIYHLKKDMDSPSRFSQAHDSFYAAALAIKIAVSFAILIIARYFSMLVLPISSFFLMGAAFLATYEGTSAIAYFVKRSLQNDPVQ